MHDFQSPGLELGPVTASSLYWPKLQSQTKLKGQKNIVHMKGAAKSHYKCIDIYREMFVASFPNTLLKSNSSHSFGSHNGGLGWGCNGI